MEKYFDDKLLGRVIIRTNPRARRYIVKIDRGKVVGVMPKQGNEEELLAFILSNKQKLREKLDEAKPLPLLDESCRLETETFKVCIVRSPVKEFHLFLKKGLLLITCPLKTDFADEDVQETLRQMLISALRHDAQKYLPARLKALAKKYGFEIGAIRINSSRTRWGSCSEGKNINLSCHLMQLPWHLIDYVLLHELCHTREMNHSPRFWAWMDKVTHQQAQKLRQELKQYYAW